MSKKKAWTIILLVVLCALIAILPLMMLHDTEFGGADGAAQDAITEINPEYQPWAQSILEPPGGETESLLFCLQAAIGAAVIGFGFGYLVARKKYSNHDD